MEKDIVPALLESIQTDFNNRTQESKKLKRALSLLKNKKATYLDANEFAIEVGEILADVLNIHVTVDVLPDGKMYFNIADRILNDTMRNNYDLIAEYTEMLQTELNHEAAIRLKGQVPELNQDRIDGIVNRLASELDFESAKWLLDEPIVNFSQSVVDDAIKANVEFHYKAGLKPKITRKVDGHKACKWCRSLAGTFDYKEAPKDVYRRHERCKCTVEYIPNGSKRQDVWTKEWKDPNKSKKIRERKQMNLTERTW